MKVGIITGSYPPDVCGVGDYSNKLVRALEKVDIGVSVITHSDWRFKSLRCIINKLANGDQDLLHLQYPTAGYGYSVLPQLLCVLYPMVVTLHEFSQAHLLRKIALLPFAIWAKRIVFTSHHEQQCAVTFFPWIRVITDVIPIGSNIPISSCKSDPNKKEIIYFGLIRLNKGLEKIVTLAERIADLKLPYVIRIIGNADLRHAGYKEQLQLQTRNLPVVWETGLDDHEVADLLACATVAYLPFPDGVSERRGSLLAVLANGVPIVTTCGKHTSQELMNCVIFADGVEDVLRNITRLLEDDNYRDDIRQKGYRYMQKFSWGHIASQHVNLYQSLLKAKMQG
jgi:glycosyltransferase involved in cell wall biosynthesis